MDRHARERDHQHVDRRRAECAQQPRRFGELKAVINVNVRMRWAGRCALLLPQQCGGRSGSAAVLAGALVRSAQGQTCGSSLKPKTQRSKPGECRSKQTHRTAAVRSLKPARLWTSKFSQRYSSGATGREQRSVWALKRNDCWISAFAADCTRKHRTGCDATPYGQQPTIL